ncbi:alpha/beta hydrolase [Leifsonia shinshuensis]|uniref:alpha/beta fold hydrolase n=1 Tax=Leifsonia shinshuensis TaxID=150026 RepID=UPI00285D7CED|nr:alpha/beta hydrolase [Leifsonia shinshuensis]MDR6972112.1 pimeloyl-ACP methyl ester carboxylesterase [Leifsonia shinshuensis]
MSADRDPLPTPAAVVTVDTGGDAGRSAGAGPVFVLVHGIGVSSRYFERLVPALAEEGRVIAVDLPGFGKARPLRPRLGFSIEEFADAVARALDGLGVSEAVIVGHSMGTQVAVCLADRRPDLVRALALLGPVMAPDDRNPLRAGALLGLDTLREDARGNRIVIGDYLHCGVRWYLATLPAMLGYETEREIERVSVPTLVVRGGRDPIARDGWVDALAERSGGGAARVPGVAHLVMHGAPWRTAELIASLVAAPGSDASQQADAAPGRDAMPEPDATR